MITYVKSNDFKSNFDKNNKDNLIIEACTKIVISAISIPVQLLVNFITEDEHKDDAKQSKSKERNEGKSENSTWRQISYDIAYNYKRSIKESLNELILPVVIKNPKQNSMPTLDSLLIETAHTVLDLFKADSLNQHLPTNQNAIAISPNSTFFQSAPEQEDANSFDQYQSLEDLKNVMFYDPKDNYQNVDRIIEFIEIVEKRKAAQKSAKTSTPNKDVKELETTSLLCQKKIRSHTVI
jgi:hypothetical protein